MILHPPESLKAILDLWRDTLVLVLFLHLAKFNLLRWIQLGWKLLQLRQELVGLLHFLVHIVSLIHMIIQLLQNAVLARSQATDALVLLLMQVVQLFLFLRLELGTSILHANELLHAILLLVVQVSLDVLVFLQQVCQIFFFSR